MPETPSGTSIPQLFVEASTSVRAAAMRSELSVHEIAAPSDLAPFAIALACDVLPARHGSDSELGTGRFVLLYDPAAPEAWGGVFRVVCFVQAPLETEIGTDPFLADVAWSWLMDALASHEAVYAKASGTATKILSTGYGELADQGDGAQIEIRASWSPSDANIASHVEGWGELMCMLAGLPPGGDGVASLSARRASRG